MGQTVEREHEPFCSSHSRPSDRTVSRLEEGTCAPARRTSPLSKQPKGTLTDSDTSVLSTHPSSLRFGRLGLLPASGFAFGNCIRQLGFVFFLLSGSRVLLLARINCFTHSLILLVLIFSVFLVAVFV